MDWLEIAVETDRLAQEAVADLLQDITGRGVVIDDPALAEQYKNEGKWDAWDIPEASLPVDRVLIKAYLPEGDEFTARLEEIRARLTNLGREFFGGRAGENPGGLDIPVSMDNPGGVESPPVAELRLRKIQEEDWATSWKAFFKPVHVTGRIVIKPTWENYTPRPGETILELDPGMAFGTGTHPTTGMCLKALENYLRPGQRVLDVGTGSGILAVAAAKLGAMEALAVDIDETAVRVAGENIIQNGVSEKVTARRGDLLTGIGENAVFDIVVANIIADIIMQLTPAMPKVLAPHGIFIASGIIDSRWPEVRQNLQDHSFGLLEVLEEGGWVAVVARQGG